MTEEVKELPARSIKNKIVHEVVRIKTGPNRIREIGANETSVIDEDLIVFSCGKWGRESSVERVDEPISCLNCLAQEKYVDRA